MVPKSSQVGCLACLITLLERAQKPPEIQGSPVSTDCRGGRGLLLGMSTSLRQSFMGRHASSRKVVEAGVRKMGAMGRRELAVIMEKTKRFPMRVSAPMRSMEGMASVEGQLAFQEDAQPGAPAERFQSGRSSLTIQQTHYSTSGAVNRRIQHNQEHQEMVVTQDSRGDAENVDHHVTGNRR